MRKLCVRDIDVLGFLLRDRVARRSARNGGHWFRIGAARTLQPKVRATPGTFAGTSPVVRATGDEPVGVSPAVRATPGTHSAAGETVGTFVGSFRDVDETVDAFAGDICLIFGLLRSTEASWVS